MENKILFKNFKGKLDNTLIDIERYKTIALNRLSPIKPVDVETIAKKDFLFTATRSDAGRYLPEYYLIYFLLSNLLGFKNLGRSEKITWSFPIDFKGKAFLIEYRKFGVGVFVQDKDQDEDAAKEITEKINNAINSIKGYFDYIAKQAVLSSKFNVVNNNRELFDRFQYLLSLYKVEYDRYIEHKGETQEIVRESEYGRIINYKSLDLEYRENANWLAISCIESFFSWTEHLFIHIAIIYQGLSDGITISSLIEAEWKAKFKAAIPIYSKESTQFYNELIIVRQQLRNFIAHGSFGKNGNAFEFHSGTGAVPVIMSHHKKGNKFSLYGTLAFNEQAVIKLIEDFIAFLWNGVTGPTMYYTQECALPTILTFASDGKYKRAIKSMKAMKEFAEGLSYYLDNAANMDWC